MSTFFNLPFSIYFTKRVPVDHRLVVDNLTKLSQTGTAFSGLGPIWVESEKWYYYFEDEITYKRWPVGSGSDTGSVSDEYLFENLTVDFKGQESISIDSTYSSHFLLIENLMFKKDVDFNEVINGINKYVTWDNKNGLLEEDDNVILVYKNL